MKKINTPLKKNTGEMKSSYHLDRRDFLRHMGGGIIILFSAAEFPFLQGMVMPSEQAQPDFNAYLRIGEDGRVSCFTGKIEMGQGVITSLAQELADELDVSLDSIDMVMGDTDLCPYDQGTWGSMTTRFFGPQLRAAGAEARAILIELASEKLKLPVDRLQVKDGVVYDTKKSKKKITYAELTKGEKLVRSLSEKPPVKNPSEHKVIGQPVFKRDALEKVTGKAKYAGDFQFPGMLYAKILRPPAHGAKLKSLDVSRAEKMEGVMVVQDDDLIAVLHENPDTAETALAKIKAEFEIIPSEVNSDTIFEHLVKSATETDIVSQGGNLDEGRKLSDMILEGQYHDGYKAHAAIEPHAATAIMEGERIIIWASTQSPFGIRSEVAEALHLPEQNICIKQTFIGGGFGGKAPGRQVVEAARLTKLTGKPVQVVWTRREVFFYDTFRPAAVVKITSGMTGSGKVTLWDYKVYFAGSRGSQHFFDVPHHKTESLDSGSEDAHLFATGAWRAPANNTNTWARESHIDMMASKAGIDPLEFRLSNIKDERMIRVLKAAADKFGWTPAKIPSGRGYGIACGSDAGTYVAHIAEVKVDKSTGNVQVIRVVCAQEMGLIINPQGATIQVEGCITMGLGYALTEDVIFDGGKIITRNYDTYEIPKFSWTPEIETVLVDAHDSPPQGGGEPAIICMGGVVANAIFDACGARVYQLPMTPERILEAMKVSETVHSGAKRTEWT
jgi:nicotinate dehydrogenase subunit B